MGVNPTAPRRIFVLGHFRSGTTLLQRLLNSYPEVLIWGEHGGYLTQMAEAYYSVVDTKGDFFTSDWKARLREGQAQGLTNPFDEAEWRALYRDFLCRTFDEKAEGRLFCGFKETRYESNPSHQTLRFLAELFPEAMFVFIARNGFDVMASWRRMKQRGLPTRLSSCGRICDRWVYQNESFLRFHQAGRHKSYWIRYDELIAGKGEIHRLLADMGESWTQAQDALLKSPSDRISSFAPEETAFTARWKDLPPAWLAFTAARIGRANKRLGFENPRLSHAMKALGAALSGFYRLWPIAYWFQRRVLPRLAGRTLKAVPELACALALAAAALCAAPAHAFEELEGGWKLIWNDEFDGDALDLSKWTPEDAALEKNNEAQYYSPENVAVRDGLLVLTSERRAKGGRPYTSGLVETRGKFARAFGRYEVRAKLPRGAGIWPAHWLMPDDNSWPPEIDIMELLGHRPDKVHMTHHFRKEGSFRSKGESYVGPDFTKEFHVFAVEWEPDEIRWYVDGVQRFSVKEDIPDVPMRIILNTAVGGNWPGYPTKTTVFPQTHEIDYVRVYARDPKNIDYVE